MNTNHPDAEYEIGEPDGIPVVNLKSVEALLVLSEIATERGVTTVAEIGNLPPLDPQTKAMYLARAKKRAKEAGLDAC